MPESTVKGLCFLVSYHGISQDPREQKERGTNHKTWQACTNNAHTNLGNSHKPRKQQVVGQVDTVFEIESNQEYQANDTCDNNPIPGEKLSVKDRHIPSSDVHNVHSSNHKDGRDCDPFPTLQLKVPNFIHRKDYG